MIRNTIPVLAAASILCFSAGRAGAGGRGGYHGGFAAGGYRGVEVGGYRGGEVGGYRGAEIGGYRGGEVGGYRGAEIGGYRGGEVGGYRVGGVEVGHASLATDFGFGHIAGAGGYRTAGHYTTAYNPSILAARGTAVRGDFYRYGAFNDGWWAGHRGAWRPFGWNAAAAWGWATWPGLCTWFGWTAPPLYYDYGNTIVYQGDQVYIDGQPGPTAPVYYQQAADLALSAPPPPPMENKDDQWQPLGVFSLVQGDQSDTSAVFQLAVNKEGIIRGNYYNVLTDSSLPVRGAAARRTQRASWIVGDQKNVVYDTGLDNLTRDESPVLIHFGKDRTQQWLLVRIKEKDGQAPQAVAANVAAPPPPPVDGDSIAHMTVIVPADAEVFFDGTLMTEAGTERSFKSPPLEKGATYRYTIRARWTADGKPVEQTRKVLVQAGERVRLDFLSPLP